MTIDKTRAQDSGIIFYISACVLLFNNFLYYALLIKDQNHIATDKLVTVKNLISLYFAKFHALIQLTLQTFFVEESNIAEECDATAAK